MFAISFALGLLLSAPALVLSVIAVLAVRARRSPVLVEARVAALEEQVRGLLYRVWTLERAGAPGDASAPAGGADPAVPATSAVDRPSEPPPAPLVTPAVPTGPVGATETPAPPAPPLTRLDLEQRIGARWATWVGIVVILVAVALFLKWAFDNAYLGAAARVGIGIVVGLLMLAGGLALHRRRDVPYLSEGLAGGGLGVLYLSLYAAHAVYGLLGPPAAFAGMCTVTLLGALVAVLTSRLSIAVLAVLGGLLTPLLLQVDRPDERNLLAYLLVLDALALLVARFRTWSTLNRLAWIGTAFLSLLTLQGRPDAPRPVARLLLLSALFLVFLAAPLFRERIVGRRAEPIDLALVVANAAAYFWAVYVTLEAWRPGLEGPYALALALLYRLAAADYAARVADDAPTVIVHEGASWTFLTLAIPLGLGGQWITLAWAVQGVMLVWLASRTPSVVAAWGGLAALLLAALRTVALDPYWAPETVPIRNLAFLTHMAVVAALVVGGALAGRMRGERLGGLTPEWLRATLWVAAAGTLAVQLWREPSGLWPATLLTAELLVVGVMARGSRSPAFVVAVPLLAVIVAGRVVVADDALARDAIGTLVNLPVLSRIAACLSIGLAGGGLARSPQPAARPTGQLLSGSAGLMLLFVLSLHWTRYQSWRTQVGLSVLWALYAGGALAWGFIRRNAALRYAALVLLGFTVLKVFVVDLAAVKTAYRILSFLVLGLVLLLVGLAYQRLLSKPSKLS